jgi:uncharacterized damage-inducible protein DinB
MMLEEQLIETWAIHNRIHLYLLEALNEAALDAAFAPRGRTVFALFAHIHNVRLMWLKSAAPELHATQQKIEAREADAVAQLRNALVASGAALETLARSGLAQGGRIKGFKPHAAAFIGYLIAHESHHRGQIEVALRLSGQALPDKISYGLWEWGSR